MKTIARGMLAAAAIALLAAIWAPWHWQLAATALVLAFIAAAILGQKHAPETRQGRQETTGAPQMDTDTAEGANGAPKGRGARREFGEKR